MGGESIYGESFADEIHSRLRFNRRGLLGMANNSKRNTNNSQWFITLDRADELTGRHTLFGRIQGPTYYSAYEEVFCELTGRCAQHWQLGS
ncbi:hypothetical protein VHUM_03795 [Vanrija humicola]|uniref:PPIase cyclophilin-type domain-containing protein n=1 Tax=Vanrija humicola TaxID=5417 RepID=A0A7D8UWK9_VANHU|nr:hypothetical protein VHUM_03795 [Vanrija humicola]